MATVVFAFANRPGIDEPDALEIAELLARTRNLAAVRAAGKIAEQARRHPARREVGEDIALDGAETVELFALLSAPSATPANAAVSNLHRELTVALTSNEGV